jgi:hypothetical protein
VRSIWRRKAPFHDQSNVRLVSELRNSPDVTLTMNKLRSLAPVYLVLFPRTFRSSRAPYDRTSRTCRGCRARCGLRENHARCAASRPSWRRAQGWRSATGLVRKQRSHFPRGPAPSCSPPALPGPGRTRPGPSPAPVDQPRWTSPALPDQPSPAGPAPPCRTSPAPPDQPRPAGPAKPRRTSPALPDQPSPAGPAPPWRISPAGSAPPDQPRRISPAGSAPPDQPRRTRPAPPDQPRLGGSAPPDPPPSPPGRPPE